MSEKLKEIIENMPKDVLINSFETVYEDSIKKDLEIERLNNIMNELENYFNKIKDTSTLEERMIAKYMLKYIKELKGEDKE